MKPLVDVVGNQHVPEDGPILFVSNHANRILDVAILRAAIPRRAKFLAHTDILNTFALFALLYRESVIPVEDSLKAMSTAVDECKAALSNGQAIVIFPEGRAMGNGHGEYRTGAAYVAAHAQCMVTPVRIQRTSLIRYRVTFGEPIEPPSSRDRVTLKKHTQVMKEQILAL